MAEIGSYDTLVVHMRSPLSEGEWPKVILNGMKCESMDIDGDSAVAVIPLEDSLADMARMVGHCMVLVGGGVIKEFQVQAYERYATKSESFLLGSHPPKARH